MTMALIAASPNAATTPSFSPLRTPWLRELKGGWLTVRTATRPRQSRSTNSVMAVMIGSSSEGLLGCAPPRQGVSPAWGKLGTPHAPPHEMRLVHLPLQRRHDLAMWVFDNKLVEGLFALPHGQGPKLPLEYTR